MSAAPHGRRRARAVADADGRDGRRGRAAGKGRRAGERQARADERLGKGGVLIAARLGRTGKKL